MTSQAPRASAIIVCLEASHLVPACSLRAFPVTYSRLVFKEARVPTEMVISSHATHRPVSSMTYTSRCTVLSAPTGLLRTLQQNRRVKVPYSLGRVFSIG
ncbi:hypothetical protein E4U42_005833 [Claviceps africana]|uniref:Uncharacterized protein n=1 Tax=Claviceps africana TaxID=83212 RepID=A0A8K0NJR1_9HYPO|nr:hypothetical protein E4U42_005833 [Claviceps africana]